MIDARHGPDDARDPPAGADDHLAVDLLAQDPVRGADVVLALGRDRRGLQPEAGLAHRPRGLVDDLVARLAPLLEREVVVVELELDPEQLGVEHPHGLLEQLLAGLVALEDDDLQRVRHGRTEPSSRRLGAREAELVGVRLAARRRRTPRARRSRSRAARRPRASPSRSTARGERRRLHLLLDRLGREPVDPLRAHVGARHHEARELVDGEQGLLHRRVARDLEVVGVRGDRADHVLGELEPLELGQRVARVAGVKIRIALVVEVVEHPDHAPALGVLAELLRVGAHARLDGEHVAAQALGRRPLAEQRPGLVTRHGQRHATR